MSQLFTQNRSTTLKPPRRAEPAYNGAVLAMLAMSIAGIGMFVHYAATPAAPQISHFQVVNPSVLNLRNAEAARHHRAAQ